jgi:hypothetical protein
VGDDRAETFEAAGQPHVEPGIQPHDRRSHAAERGQVRVALGERQPKPHPNLAAVGDRPRTLKLRTELVRLHMSEKPQAPRGSDRRRERRTSDPAAHRRLHHRNAQSVEHKRSIAEHRNADDHPAPDRPRRENAALPPAGTPPPGDDSLACAATATLAVRELLAVR